MQGTNKLLRFTVYYTVGIFAVGFVLGTIRTLLLAPRIGALAAVTAEVPVMLLIAWFYCRWLIHRLGINSNRAQLLAWGLLAFTLLTAIEFTVSVFAFGQTATQFIGNLLTPAGLLGLAGQFLFGLIPVIQGGNQKLK
ncbi:MAG: hypothetical protein RLZZ367_937 [Bacteroidota bacterium]|jgi:hypothetical protein